MALSRSGAARSGPTGVRRMAFDADTSLRGHLREPDCAAEMLINTFKATVHKATNPAVRRLVD